MLFFQILAMIIILALCAITSYAIGVNKGVTGALIILHNKGYLSKEQINDISEKL